MVFTWFYMTMRFVYINKSHGSALVCGVFGDESIRRLYRSSIVGMDFDAFAVVRRRGLVMCRFVCVLVALSVLWFGFTQGV